MASSRLVMGLSAITPGAVFLSRIFLLGRHNRQHPQHNGSLQAALYAMNGSHLPVRPNLDQGHPIHLV